MKVSGKDGVFTKQFFTTDEERAEYKIIPLDEATSLESALFKANFLGERAHGVVPTRKGLAIRVLASDYPDAIRQIRPEDAQRFLGKTWEVSGLPLGMGKEALEAFLQPWQVSPLYTFKSGMRRTWGVRAVENPSVTKVQHDGGLAVVQEAPPRQAQAEIKVERWQRPTAPPSSRASQPPRSWSDVVKEKNIGNSARVPPSTGSLASASKSTGLDSQTMQQAIAAAINAAMTPFIAQMDALKKDVADMQDAEMEFEDDVASEASSTAAGATKKIRKLKLSIKKGVR